MRNNNKQVFWLKTGRGPLSRLNSFVPALVFISIHACIKTKTSQLNYDPNSPKWSQPSSGNPLLSEFQDAHPKYKGFAKAFEISSPQGSGSSFSFTYALVKPLAGNTGLSLDQTAKDFSTSPTESPVSSFSSTPAPQASSSNPASTSTLKITFGSVGQAVTLDFQFRDPAESTAWASYVKKLAAPLAKQEPAKAYLEELEVALAGSSSGKVNFSFDYKEASVLTVFLWPCIENDFAKKP